LKVARSTSILAEILTRCRRKLASGLSGIASCKGKRKTEREGGGETQVSEEKEYRDRRWGCTRLRPRSWPLLNKTDLQVTRALWPGRKRERGAGSRSHATRRPRAGTTSLQLQVPHVGAAAMQAGMHARATHAAGDTSHAPSARVPRRRATSSGARARTATRGPHGATWRPPRLRWPPGVPRCALRPPARGLRSSAIDFACPRPPFAAFANLHRRRDPTLLRANSLKHYFSCYRVEEKCYGGSVDPQGKNISTRAWETMCTYYVNACM